MFNTLINIAIRSCSTLFYTYGIRTSLAPPLSWFSIASMTGRYFVVQKQQKATTQPSFHICYHGDIDRFERPATMNISLFDQEKACCDRQYSKQWQMM